MRSLSKMLLGAVAMSALIGCGPSEDSEAGKAELASTKQQLDTVTAERDSLKTELESTKQQLTAVQDQLAQAKAAPPPEPPAAAAAEPAAEPKQARKPQVACGTRGRTFDVTPLAGQI